MTAPLSAEAILKLAAEVAGDPERFGSYFDKPVEFAHDILGVNLWAKQKEAAEALIESHRVAAKSGHGVGKTTIAACIVLWWLYARKGWVITTGPTKEQVEDVLWREIGLRWRRALVPLPGECYTSYLKVRPEWYAVGVTSDQPGALQGRHDRHLLVVVDEAAEVSESIFEAISTLVTGAENTVFLIGNPTTTSGTFHDAFNKQGPWKTISISCLDHPNVVQKRDVIPGAVSHGWVEEMRQKHGETSPFWYSRIIGEFPKLSTKGVIPRLWVEGAFDEEMREKAVKDAEEANLPRIGGLDVARYGDNKCVMTIRRGDAVEAIVSWSHTTLMETTGLAIKFLRDWELSTLVVDASGIGAGVCDRLTEQGIPVLAFNSGHRAFTPSVFANRRSELWWALRTRFEKQLLWLPKGEHRDQLLADLVAPEYGLNSTGRIMVESKEKLLERGIKSPDFADSLVLCFAADEDPVEPAKLKLGKDQDPTPMDYSSVDAHFDQFPVGF